MKLIKDLGMIFSTEKSKHKIRHAIVECEICGKESRVQYRYIKQESCRRCSNIKSATKHGYCKEKLFKRYTDMINRCYLPRTTGYSNYGGKGVAVCDEWKNNYESFRSWSLSNGYEDNLELDKDIKCKEMSIYPAVYSPETCTWITKKLNMQEAKGIEVTINGITYPSKTEAQRQTGINRNTL
mgnify:FL=1